MEAPATAQRSLQADVPTFHGYSEEWWTLREHQWAPKTVEDYRWRLEKHLLKHFGEMPLDTIDYATVERYIAAKRRQGLSARSSETSSDAHRVVLRRLAAGCELRSLRWRDVDLAAGWLTVGQSKTD